MISKNIFFQEKNLVKVKLLSTFNKFEPFRFGHPLIKKSYIIQYNQNIPYEIKYKIILYKINPPTQPNCLVKPNQSKTNKKIFYFKQ